MEALTIFKNAGLSDYLNPDAIKGYMSNLSPYAKAGLTGAGVGAAGMGLASLFGGEEDESGGDKISRILGNMLKGTALGGAAGLGGQAVYENFFKPNAGLPPGIADLKEKLKNRTGQELDTQPFGVHHPIEQAAVTATHQSPAFDATVGGAAGVGANYMQGRKVDKLLKVLQDKGVDGDHMKGIATLPSDIKKRLIEKLVPRMNGTATVSNLMNELNYGNVQNVKGSPSFASQVDEFTRGGQIGAGQYKVGPGNRGIKTPGLSMFGKDIIPEKRFFENNAKLNAVKEYLVNKVGPATGGFAGNNLKRYGKAGLIGAGAGMAAGAAGRGVVDSALALKYSPEQIAAWSQM